MTARSEKYLRDMLDAAETETANVEGVSREQFHANRIVRDAVTWNFCVIGEALSQLFKIDLVTAGRLTDARKTIGLRNQLIHGYNAIDDDITWFIIVDHLPVLIQELRDLLE